MKIRSFSRILSFAVCLSLGTASADLLLKEDWDGHADGDVPMAPWKVWSGNPPGSVGTVEVVEQGSPFGGSRSARLEGLQSGAAGPALIGKFSEPTSGAIVVKFDFYIPSSPGAGVLPSVNIRDSEGKSVLRLNLANSFLLANQAPQIALQGKTFSEGEIIRPFAPDTWYHVEITTRESKGQKTCDISVTPFDKEPIEVSGLPLGPDVTNFASIEVGWNSTNPAGAIYLSNLEVETAQ
jgi:hypothetical protein